MSSMSWSGPRAPNPYILAYQSDVGPVRWLGPSTASVIRHLGAKGSKDVLVVPIAFTSDHIETLSELDKEYGDVAKEAGITNYVRAPALNDRPLFLDALANIVRDHIPGERRYSTQYLTRCAGCTNPACRQFLPRLRLLLHLLRQLRHPDRATDGIQHPTYQPVGHLSHNLALTFRQLGKLVEGPRRFLRGHLHAEAVELRELGCGGTPAEALLETRSISSVRIRSASASATDGASAAGQQSR